MPIVKYADTGISPRVGVYAVRKMLSKVESVEILAKLGLVTPVPANEGLTIKWRRPRVEDESIVPLTEGVTPKSKTFRYDDITATLKQYGEVLESTDVIEDTHEDPVLKDMAEASGDNIGRTQEALIYAIVRAGTNVFYQNGSARTDVNTAITRNKLMATVRSLKAQKAQKITKILAPSAKFNTRAVRGAFVAVTHTDMQFDIENLPGFLPVSDYGTMDVINEHELGSVGEIRFLLSPDLDPFADAGGTTGAMKSTTGTLADVYPVLIFGKEAFAIAALRGKSAVAPTILPASQVDKSDPLGQRSMVGWKIWFTAVITDDTWMARLEVGCTAL
jgi:N4-gp56 family major capsid protein